MFVYKHLQIIEYVKLSMQLTPEIVGLRNVKFSGYCIHMNKTVMGDFQICISVSFTDIHISSFNSEKF